MNKEIILLLIGAGIALVSSIVTSVTNHLLSLRADKIKRERDKVERRTNAKIDFLTADTRNTLTRDFLRTMDDIKNIRISNISDNEETNKKEYVRDYEGSENYIAFNKLIKDKEWVKKHSGIYVAIVSGKIVDQNSDYATLKQKTEKKFPTRDIFIKKVVVGVEEIPIPWTIVEKPQSKLVKTISRYFRQFDFGSKYSRS